MSMRTGNTRAARTSVPGLPLPLTVHLTARSAPDPGDVVVRIEAGESEPRYVLSLHPDAGQVAYKTRESAMTVAQGYAHQHGSRIWVDEDGTVTLVQSTDPPPDRLSTGALTDGRPRRKMAKAR